MIPAALPPCTPHVQHAWAPRTSRTLRPVGRPPVHAAWQVHPQHARAAWAVRALRLLYLPTAAAARLRPQLVIPVVAAARCRLHAQRRRVEQPRRRRALVAVVLHELKHAVLAREQALLHPSAVPLYRARGLVLHRHHRAHSGTLVSRVHGHPHAHRGPQKPLSDHSRHRIVGTHACGPGSRTRRHGGAPSRFAHRPHMPAAGPGVPSRARPGLAPLRAPGLCSPGPCCGRRFIRVQKILVLFRNDCSMASAMAWGRRGPARTCPPPPPSAAASLSRATAYPCRALFDRRFSQPAGVVRRSNCDRGSQAQSRKVPRRGDSENGPASPV